MNKYIIAVVVAVIVIVAGASFAMRSRGPGYGDERGERRAQYRSEMPETPEIPAAVTASTTAASVYTLAQVQSHKDATSCWTTISGKVYDVTSWIAKHPGGKKAILETCGVDATDQFTGKHGGERRPESELAKYLIGTLAN